jgi:hypothetical protein
MDTDPRDTQRISRLLVMIAKHELRHRTGICDVVADVKDTMIYIAWTDGAKFRWAHIKPYDNARMAFPGYEAGLYASIRREIAILAEEFMGRNRPTLTQRGTILVRGGRRGGLRNYGLSTMG